MFPNMKLCGRSSSNLAENERLPCLFFWNRAVNIFAANPLLTYNSCMVFPFLPKASGSSTCSGSVHGHAHQQTAALETNSVTTSSNGLLLDERKKILKNCSLSGICLAVLGSLRCTCPLYGMNPTLSLSSFILDASASTGRV